MSFVVQLAKTNNTPIHYVRCKDAQGRDCYYFVMASYEKMKLLQAPKEGVYNINDYGKILVSGYGTTPSDLARRRMLEEHNFDIDELVKDAS